MSVLVNPQHVTNKDQDDEDDRKRFEEDYEDDRKLFEEDYPLCPVCLELMLEPCELPCKHKLCKDCILKLMRED